MITKATVIRWAILGALLVFALAAAFYQFALSAPRDFISGSSIIVEPGETISGVANALTEANIVRSPILFRSLVILYGGERSTSAGMYVFDKRQNVFRVAYRISKGDYGYVPVKLTIPEGLNVVEISELIGAKFPHIYKVQAINALGKNEGKLFPETYFFPPLAPLSMIEDRLKLEFEKNIKPLEDDIAKSGRTLDEIIIVASILEEEVQNDTDRRLVADIIWRRLKIGMPLQVDSTLGYVLSKASLQLTKDDLQVDSPYNSYRYKGLPPTPISNPGIEAIDAAIHPTPNNYLFFLSDKDGINHFAVTHSDHVKNRKKYLGK